MALTLVCRCGTRFTVEETFAGQAVACPECQEPVRVPAADRQRRRTSGYAVASVVLGLTFMFTVVGTAISTLLGVIALVSIARHRDRLAGAGYAWFGIVWGLLFTGLSLFAFTRGELLMVGEELQAYLNRNEIERGGPAEVLRAEDGFAISRPSDEWGVAKAKLHKTIGEDSSLVLVDPRRDSYLTVSAHEAGGATAAEWRENFLAYFRQPQKKPATLNDQAAQPKKFRLRATRKAAAPAGADVEEAEFDVRLLNQPITFLVRFVRPADDGKMYVLKFWCHARRYPRMEAEVRRSLDSFRLVADDKEP
jgi:hypothetical protein